MPFLALCSKHSYHKACLFRNSLLSFLGGSFIGFEFSLLIALSNNVIMRTQYALIMRVASALVQLNTLVGNQ